MAKAETKQAAAAVGVGGEVLPGSRVEEVVFSETRDEIAGDGPISTCATAGPAAGSASGPLMPPMTTIDSRPGPGS